MSIKAPKEGDILKVCLQWLELNGYHVWRNNTGAAKIGNRFIRFGVAGLSDIIGWTRPTWDGVENRTGGRFLAIECKKPGRYPTKLQREFLEALNAAGGVGIVATSLEDMINGLRDRGA